MFCSGHKSERKALERTWYPTMVMMTAILGRPMTLREVMLPQSIGVMSQEINCRV